MTPVLYDPTLWKDELSHELLDNILPFWLTKTIDHQNGGFYGSLTNQLKIDNSVGRSAILNTRILWTFSAAYLYKQDPQYIKIADYAHDYIRQHFIDPLCGGLFWMVDASGQVTNDRKHSYVQAFAIYSLSEYYRACGKEEALREAQDLFALLEKYTYEPKDGGYLEGKACDWSELQDTRLSEREPESSKTMNTLLHVLEAFTALYRVWKDPLLEKRLSELVTIFLDHVIDPQKHHLRLFFNNTWKSSGTLISYGHDIEASWLLQEAANALGQKDLVDKTRQAAVRISQAVYQEGLWPDGSIIYETDGPGYINRERHWWPAAEGMVGFYNAFQNSGASHFVTASHNCWAFARQYLSDKQYGDWRKVLLEDYQVKPGTYKVGPWECPYHHTRACLEMIKRLEHPPAP